MRGRQRCRQDISSSKCTVSTTSLSHPDERRGTMASSTAARSSHTRWRPARRGAASGEIEPSWTRSAHAAKQLWLVRMSVRATTKDAAVGVDEAAGVDELRAGRRQWQRALMCGRRRSEGSRQSRVRGCNGCYHIKQYPGIVRTRD
jgi:hypothetical protein